MITYGCHLSVYHSQVLDFVWDFSINVSKHKRSICTLKHKHKYKLRILQIQPLLWAVAIETCTKLLVSKWTHCVNGLGNHLDLSFQCCLDCGYFLTIYHAMKLNKRNQGFGTFISEIGQKGFKIATFQIGPLHTPPKYAYLYQLKKIPKALERP